MKKNIQEEREKEYIALCKRRDEISTIKRKLPWRKLDKPIQDGWIINMRLIDEVYRREDGRRMAVALALTDKGFNMRKGDGGKITNIRKNATLSKIRPFFMVTGWDGKIFYHGPSPSSLKESLYDNLHESIQKFFTRKEHVYINKWGGQRNVTVTYELNIPEYYIGIKVKKRMLTMIQDIATELLREEAWVDDKLAPYYLFAPGSNRYSRSWSDYTIKKDRRHMKDAITHMKKGEIKNPLDYKKLNKHKL